MQTFAKAAGTMQAFAEATADKVKLRLELKMPFQPQKGIMCLWIYEIEV